MHDLATIQRMNREAVAAHERAMATITESVTEADEVAEAKAKAKAPTHKACGEPVTFNRADISEGDTESFPTGQYGNYYAAACLYCDEDLMEFEIEYPQPTQDERSAAMERHPAGKGKRLTEPAIDPATEPEQDEPDSGERTTKPLKPAEVAHLASASAHELARKVLAGFTKNGEIPFALSGQAAADIIAVAIEADRARALEDAIRAAKFLQSDDGENEEYDRALVELICDTHAIPGAHEMDDKRAHVEARLGRGGAQ